MPTFRANGKLLLTGEYFIFDGAKALALPTKFGQSLEVNPDASNRISWTSFDNENKRWFEAQFDNVLQIIKTTDQVIAERLANILTFCPINEGLQLTTYLDFPADWGLGSSSTLISLLAQYFKIDPYSLLQK